MKFVVSKTADQRQQDAETVARVRVALQSAYAVTGPGGMISVQHVLDLLDPRGLWSLDPARRRELDVKKDQPQGLPPGADPMTGCLPVTPTP